MNFAFTFFSFALNFPLSSAQLLVIELWLGCTVLELVEVEDAPEQ